MMGSTISRFDIIMRTAVLASLLESMVTSIPRPVRTELPEKDIMPRLCVREFESGRGDNLVAKTRGWLGSFPRKTVMAQRGFVAPWANNGKGVKNRYLGLKFVINGKVHYGWARLNVTFGTGSSPANVPVFATLTGYAYETIPGKAIIAGNIIAGATKGADDVEPTASLNTPTPEPNTLGMLALGAPGLTIWRRKESAADALTAN
jgi:hypothetical protein